MKYQITDGTVSLGGETVLSHIDFEIQGAQKIAVVGRNGAGKTTLLRLIAGELELERDDRRQGPGICCSRKLTIGMLGQQALLHEERTVEEYLMSWQKDLLTENVLNTNGNMTACLQDLVLKKKIKSGL